MTPGTAAAPGSLETHDVSVHYGGVRAVDEVSLSFKRGEVTGLIGPNGSGKSTTLAALSRLVALTSGRLRVGGLDYTTVPAHQMASLGISRSFQTVKLIPDLTVVENVMLGADPRRRGLGYLEGLVSWRASARRDDAARGKAVEALSRLGLGPAEGRLPEELSYGQQRRVEFARALMAEPSFLLLDEPTAGMSDKERQEIATVIADLQRGGMGVVVVEHNLAFIRTLCRHVYVMDQGAVLAAGSPSEVGEDERVVRAYLGKRA